MSNYSVYAKTEKSSKVVVYISQAREEKAVGGYKNIVRTLRTKKPSNYETYMKSGKIMSYSHDLWQSQIGMCHNFINHSSN